MTPERAVHDPDHSRRIDELVALLAKIRDEEMMGNFLRDLCTRNEIETMAQRWEVAQLVDQGVPYLKIAERTGASTATITRVAQWLRHGQGGYAAALKRRRP
jgi:TrpR-related protein YerC/YecD